MMPSDYIKQGWCQKATALDSDGNWVNPQDPAACQWCLYGALVAVFKGRKFLKAYKSVVGVLNGPDKAGCTLMKWNDNPKRTKADVMKLLLDLEL